MNLTALSWNLFHGRDFPPDPALFTWRSRLLRATERNRTHVQLNRELFDEFAATLGGATWDVALLQECPPRWSARLGAATDSAVHRALTSRNSAAPLRAFLARLNPDLIASNEGGSNTTLVRHASGSILDRCELTVSRSSAPERRVVALTRIALGAGPGPARELCVANLHASAGERNRVHAEREVELAAERATEWAADRPLILGGDLNVRPRDSDLYERLERRHGLRGVTGPGSLDHLLARGLEVVQPARAWSAEKREVSAEGRAIRLSDHAPIEAAFAL